MRSYALGLLAFGADVPVVRRVDGVVSSSGNGLTCLRAKLPNALMTSCRSRDSAILGICTFDYDLRQHDSAAVNFMERSRRG